MEKQQKQHLKKEKYLAELELTLGIVSHAAKRCGVDRTTPYRWMREDEEFADKCDEIQNVVLDFTESKMYELVDEKNVAAVIFTLKTKGKSRGWVEKQEMDVNLGGRMNLSVHYI